MRVRAASRMSTRRCSRSPHRVGGRAGRPSPPLSVLVSGPGVRSWPSFRTLFDSATGHRYGTRSPLQERDWRTERSYERLGEPVQLWTMKVPSTDAMVEQARRAEAAGWTGVTYTDSQNLCPDPYVGIALAARATERLRFATGVTNAHTRHPAALATTVATVEEVSGGRFVLGIGRGDTALFHLGLPPMPVAPFVERVTALQTYLAGGSVDAGGRAASSGWPGRVRRRSRSTSPAPAPGSSPSPPAWPSTSPSPSAPTPTAWPGASTTPARRRPTPGAAPPPSRSGPTSTSAATPTPTPPGP